MNFKWLWISLFAMGAALLMFAVVWTAVHSALFTGCFVLVLALFAVVAVWGSQNERL